VQLVRRVGKTRYGHRLILFGFLPQSSKTKVVAAMPGLAHTRTTGPGDTPTGRGDLAGFRRELYSSLTARADALFELTEAVLCTEGPVTSLVELTLVVEHRRGHGAMYDALNAGRVEPERLTAAPPAGNSPLGSPSGRFSVHSRIRVSCPQAARRRNVSRNTM
jgi:hypothetical protein